MSLYSARLMIEVRDFHGLRELLEQHPEVVRERDHWSTSLLTESASQADFSAMVLLSRFGASADGVEGQIRPPLCAAMELDDEKAVSVGAILVACGADLDREGVGGTPLHNAIRMSNYKAAAMLLDAGADINARDLEDGATPLWRAVQLENLEAVRFLVEWGATRVVSDRTIGKSTLQLAANSTFAIRTELLALLEA